MIDIPKITVNVLLATAFFTLFITIFFFTYAKYIEKQIVIKNLTYLVKDMTSNLILLPPEYKQYLSSIVNDVDISINKQADIDVENSNNELFMYSIKIYGGIFITNIVLAFIISSIYNIDMIESLFQNINLLIVVMVTEFLFLTFIIADYISIHPNKIKKEFINVLQNK